MDCFLFKIFEWRRSNLLVIFLVWVKMVKKVSNTSPSTFDQFAGHLQRVCKVVCGREFYSYLYGVFLYQLVGEWCLFGG